MSDHPSRPPQRNDNPSDDEWFVLVRPVGWARASDNSEAQQSTDTSGRDETAVDRAASSPTARSSADGHPSAAADPTPEHVFDWRHDDDARSDTLADEGDPGGGSIPDPEGVRVSPRVARDDDHGTDRVVDGFEADGDIRRSWWRWVALGVVVVVAAGAGYWLVIRDDSAGTASESTGPASTAEVTRETISATEAWGGRLGHGDPVGVTASGQGVLTGVADHDTEVRRGTELYRVNEHPMIVMIGAVPMYRELQQGDTGADVRQLEENLRQLGYEGFDVDDEFTSATAEAVRQWQEDIGVEETGVVSPADVIFLPHGGRVGTVHASVGDGLQPGSPVLDITSSDQVVSFDVDVRDRGLVEVGTDVAVELPGGDTIQGTVTAADVVEVTSQGDEAAGADDTVVQVEVTIDERVDNSLMGAPVDVVVEVDEREDVLVVPVNALVAMSEGGHGLEIVAADGTTSIVEVETGLFAHGKVEITGTGIDVGTIVGVAGR